MARTFREFGSEARIEIIETTYSAERLFAAIRDAIKADKKYKKAVEKVPNYTAQWHDIDYYGSTTSATVSSGSL